MNRHEFEAGNSSETQNESKRKTRNEKTRRDAGFFFETRREPQPTQLR